jgi:hypothetical protein
MWQDLSSRQLQEAKVSGKRAMLVSLVLGYNMVSLDEC